MDQFRTLIEEEGHAYAMAPSRSTYICLVRSTEVEHLVDVCYVSDWTPLLRTIT